MGELIGLAKEVGLPGYMLLLACAIGYMVMQLRDIHGAVKEVKEGKRWNETCDEKHDAVDERITGVECRVGKLETKVFGI